MPLPSIVAKGSAALQRFAIPKARRWAGTERLWPRRRVIVAVEILDTTADDADLRELPAPEDCFRFGPANIKRIA
jgi:hypothetical protein